MYEEKSEEVEWAGSVTMVNACLSGNEKFHEIEMHDTLNRRHVGDIPMIEN